MRPLRPQAARLAINTRGNAAAKAHQDIGRIVILD